MTQDVEGAKYYLTYLSFDSHIKSVTKTAFFRSSNTSRLWPSLPNDSVAEALIHTSYIASHLDYCNAIPQEVTNKTLDRLQHVQNSAARVLTCTKPWQHINLYPQTSCTLSPSNIGPPSNFSSSPTNVCMHSPLQYLTGLPRAHLPS